MKNQYFTLFSFLLNIHIVLLILTENSKKILANDDEYSDRDGIDRKPIVNANKNIKNNTYGRIIGGEIVKDISLYPYHAQYGENCGAAVIDKRWVITAAHCGRFPYILAGSAHVNSGRQFLVYRHYIHPKWSEKDKRHKYDYDFQLLEMADDIELNSRIRAVKIGYIKDLTVGKVVTVTGWGCDKEKGPLVNRLRVIEVPVVSKKKCQKIDAPYFRNKLTPRMFCAGFQKGGVDACQGDSGGPAVANFQLYGLVSFGYRCALPNVYGVYANVVRVRSWIEDTATFKV